MVMLKYQGSAVVSQEFQGQHLSFPQPPLPNLHLDEAQILITEHLFEKMMKYFGA
jgi:hypothetical protein